MTDLQSITGILVEIRYQNYDDGFIIASFTSSKDSFLIFTATGNILDARRGQEYKLFGKWVDHPRYGRQFKFDNYQAVLPQQEDGIYIYLVRTAKWIGPTIAERLIKRYGNATLEVLREDPEMVAAETPGLTIKKANDIQERLLQFEAQEAVLVELMDILNVPGIQKNLPYMLIDEYGSNAAKMLRENPYILTGFHGVGFLTADQIAIQKLKIDPKSQKRVIACITYCTKTCMSVSGSTWVACSDIEKAVSDLIGVGLVKAVIAMMIYDGLLVSALQNELISFVSADKDETYIAKKVQDAIKRKATASI